MFPSQVVVVEVVDSAQMLQVEPGDPKTIAEEHEEKTEGEQRRC